MLQHNLFTFNDLKTEENIVKTNIELNTLHSIFTGHFPGQPVFTRCLYDANGERGSRSSY